MAGSTAAAIVAPCSLSPCASAESTPSSGRRAASPGSVTTGTAMRCEGGTVLEEIHQDLVGHGGHGRRSSHGGGEESTAGAPVTVTQAPPGVISSSAQRPRSLVST